MRVLHLSWEYPPIVYGGLGRHVHALAEAQAALGHDVVVVTQGGEGLAADEVVNGVRIVRVAPEAPFVPFDEQHLLAWVMALDHALARTAVRLVGDWTPEVVHGHDWLVSHSATTAHDASGAPLVVTVHATEAGRHQGWLPTSLSRAIHTVEWWFTAEARRIIACSQHMRWEVSRLFELPTARIDVVPNGIDLGAWAHERVDAAAARQRYANDGPLVVFCGRLEWEKGVHTLLDAVPRLRRRHPGARVVVAGKGGMQERLEAQAAALRLGRAVTFTGWLPEPELHALLAAADVAVVPSIYEPFGLVALEAAALHTPVVVAETGGLAEFVEDGVSGWSFPPGDAAGLADALDRALADEMTARRVARTAYERLVADHGWDAIAARTVEVYRRAEAEERADAQVVRPRHVPHLEGNLLGDVTA